MYNIIDRFMGLIMMNDNFLRENPCNNKCIIFQYRCLQYFSVLQIDSYANEKLTVILETPSISCSYKNYHKKVCKNDKK